MPQIAFTESRVAKIKVPEQGLERYFEKLKKGLSLGLYVSYGGTKAWRALYYVGGQPRTAQLGIYPEMKVQQAKDAAYKFDPAQAIANAKSRTFAEVAADWVKEHVEASGLRSAKEIKRHLTTYVLPTWGTRPFVSIDYNDDVKPLLQRIRDVNGLRQADAVLATIRRVFNWYEVEHQNAKLPYRSPIPRNFKIDKRKADARKRDRTLTDSEIRLIWNADMGVYGSLLKLLLLTAQRREKVVAIQDGEVDDLGVWTVPGGPKETGEKGNIGKVRLPKVALDIVEGLPRIKGSPWLFPAERGDGHFNAFVERKRQIAKVLPKDMPHWTVHDLRRTARSLLARAGVADHVGEHVLGHKLTGVAGTYNRYSYFDEKSEALQKLANLLGEILTSTGDNVVRMPAPAA